MKNFLFLITLIGLNAGCSSQINDIKSLEVEFDGGKNEFYKKYNLWNTFTDKSLINKIVTSIDTSENIFNCPPHRPVMWEIDVYAKDEKDKSKHLFKIGSNTYNKLSLWKGELCYNNDSLIQMMMELMRVEEIKKFQGEMSQSDYDIILQRDR